MTDQPTPTPPPGLADVHAQALADNANDIPVGPSAYRDAVDAHRRATSTSPALDGPARLMLVDHLAATAASARLAQTAAEGIEPLTPGLGELLDKIAGKVAAARRIYHGGNPPTGPAVGTLETAALPNPTTVEINGLVALWRQLPAGMSQHGIVTALAAMLIGARNDPAAAVALAELAPQADPWAGHPLTEMYGGKDAPRCATCNRPYSRQEARAGMTTCEHCPPPGSDSDDSDDICAGCEHTREDHDDEDDGDGCLACPNGDGVNCPCPDGYDEITVASPAGTEAGQ